MRNTLLSLLLTFSFLGVFGQASYDITLKSGVIQAQDMAQLNELNTGFLQPTSFNGHYYLALQFDQILSQEEQKALMRTGVRLMGYLPNFAFMAEVPVLYDFSQLSQWNLRKVVRLKGIHKIDRSLANQNYPAHALSTNNQIDLKIMAYPTLSTEQLRAHLQASNVQFLPSAQPDKFLTVRIPIQKINELADHAPIMYMEPIEGKSTPDGIRGRTLHRANLLSPRPGVGYDGTGVTMADADDGGLSHIDFHGRLTDHTASQGGTHGDMTAGIAAGAGNLDPSKVGMGTGVYLHMYDIGGYPQVINALTNFTNLGIVITSTSYSQGGGGVYDATARDLDADVFTQKEILHVFSAGNSSGSNASSVYGSLLASDGDRYGNITGGRKAAKNSIATANLEFDDDRTASSSRGPCEDGRIKPDISANGTNQQSTAPNNGYAPGGGTSAACPGIAGVSSMLYQAYKEVNGVSNPFGSKIKGIIMNSADDLGRTGPDYDFGWGRINARKALEIIENGQHADSTVDLNQTNLHSIVVPAGLSQLKVMVNWLDPAGSITASKALVNDIDITLTTPTATTIYPWKLSTAAHIDSLQKDAGRGVDNTNNMEQVLINNPGAGTYTLTVNGTAIPSGPQLYHLSYVFVQDEVLVTYPNGGEGLIPGVAEYIRWDASGQAGGFDVSYSINGGASWTTINTNLPSDRRYTIWTVPNIITGQALVRVTRGTQTSQSASPFSIIRTPSNMNVTALTTTSASFSWNAVQGANGYDVFVLGAKYMDSVGTTSTNSFTLTNLVSGTRYWLSARARGVNGIVGSRAVAVAYDHNPNSSCSGCISEVCTFPYFEGFEKGPGDWCQGTGDDIDWTLQTGGTPSGGTGPSGASQGNYYFYIEATNPNFPNMDAILGGPCFDTRNLSTGKFLFSYHMNGTAMGSLNVQVSTDSGATWSSPIWTISGNQGTSWIRDSIDLSTYVGGSLALRFRGVTGTGFASDIAVDDLIFTGNEISPSLNINPLATNITCHGLMNGMADPNTAGGSSPYTYSWSTGATSPTLSGLSAGNYAVTVTDATGCIVRDSVSITEPPVIVTSTSSTGVRCFGNNDGSATVSASGGIGNFTYLWSNGATTSGLSNLLAGTYTTTVTDSVGCSIIDSVVVTQPDPFLANLIITDVSCNGLTDGAVAAIPSGGNGSYSYIWSTGSTSSSLSGLSPGVYSYLISDHRGCITNGSLTIGEPALIDLQPQATDISCFGTNDGMAAVTPTGGNGGFSYMWSNGDTTSSASNLGTGVYYITTTDVNGCTGSDSVTINQPTLLLVNTLGTDISCFGELDGQATAVALGGVGNYTYSWSNGGAGGSLSGLGAGTLLVTATDANGCTIVDSVVISEPPALAIASTVTHASGPTSGDGSVDISVSGGVSPYSFSWSNGTTTEDLTGLDAGTYIVTLTDANGCISIDTFIVGPTVGLSDAFELPGFRLFPNPTKKELFVTYSLDKPGPVTLDIFDMAGRQLMRQNGPSEPGTHTVTVDARTFSQGVYLLIIENGHGKGYTRWIKE